MVKLAHPRRLPLSDSRHAALDVSWTFSLSRAPGSDVLAARMTLAALQTLGSVGHRGAPIADAIELACGYVVQHGLARRYRVTVGVDGARCSVTVTDYGYDQPAAHRRSAPANAAPSHDVTALCRELSERMEGVQVHHALDGAVLVRFRTLLFPPAGPADNVGSSGPAIQRRD